MSKLKFDETGTRKYKTGVEKGVLFTIDKGVYQKGVAFSGLINFNHSPDGGEDNDFYADNIKYLTLRSAENFKASMTTYFTPEEFDQCDGTASLAPGVKIRGQERKSFGFAYLSNIGNDTQGENYAKILHLIYGCSVSPSEEEHNTINDSPEPQELSYDISSVPVPMDGYKAVSCIEIHSDDCDPAKWQQLLDMVYGTDGTFEKASYWDPSEIYYVKDASGSYIIVVNPVESDFNNYYIKTAEGTDSKLPMPSDILEMFPKNAG